MNPRLTTILLVTAVCAAPAAAADGASPAWVTPAVSAPRLQFRAFNRDFHERLVKLGIPHTFTVLPGIGHKPLAMLETLSEANWKFCRTALDQCLKTQAVTGAKS
jgi:hypothetical protein